MLKSLLPALCLTLSVMGLAASQPKYGPNAAPLSKRTNLAYFQKNSAPDFWAMMPFYVGQNLGQQCSAASFTMVLNAARSGHQELTAADELVTIDSFLEKYADERYRKAMTTKPVPGLFDRSNVANKRISEVLLGALKKAGFPNAKVEFIPIDPKNPEPARKKFHEALVANEKSADDFVVLTAFIQGTLTGDPEGGAHVAPVGAYDTEKKLVLVMDPDRKYYEPYWSPEDKVFAAIQDPKADYEQPGFVHVRLK